MIKMFWPKFNICNSKNSQKSSFAISKMAKNQFLNWEKVWNCQKCNFTKKNWFIWFHEFFFCPDFLKFSVPRCRLQMANSRVVWGWNLILPCTFFVFKHNAQSTNCTCTLPKPKESVQKMKKWLMLVGSF